MSDTPAFYGQSAFMKCPIDGVLRRREAKLREDGDLWWWCPHPKPSKKARAKKGLRAKKLITR